MERPLARPTEAVLSMLAEVLRTLLEGLVDRGLTDPDRMELRKCSFPAACCAK